MLWLGTHSVQGATLRLLQLDKREHKPPCAGIQARWPFQQAPTLLAMEVQPCKGPMTHINIHIEC